MIHADLDEEYKNVRSNPDDARHVDQLTQIQTRYPWTYGEVVVELLPLPMDVISKGLGIKHIEFKGEHTFSDGFVGTVSPQVHFELRINFFERPVKRLHPICYHARKPDIYLYSEFHPSIPPTSSCAPDPTTASTTPGGSSSGSSGSSDSSSSSSSSGGGDSTTTTTTTMRNTTGTPWIVYCSCCPEEPRSEPLSSSHGLTLIFDVALEALKQYLLLHIFNDKNHPPSPLPIIVRRERGKRVDPHRVPTIFAYNHGHIVFTILEYFAFPLAA